GVMMTLTGTDASGHAVSLTTTTDNNGYYCFLNLSPSNSAGYTVHESQPSGYIHEGQDPGSTGGTEGDHSITTVVHNGDNSQSNNFCEEKPAQICGFVYQDMNHDCMKHTGEPAIAGVTMTLPGTTADLDSVTFTTTTDANGYYCFLNLPTSSP